MNKAKLELGQSVVVGNSKLVWQVDGFNSWDDEVEVSRQNRHNARRAVTRRRVQVGHLTEVPVSEVRVGDAGYYWKVGA